MTTHPLPWLALVALLALAAAPPAPADEAVDDALAWLASRQRQDGRFRLPRPSPRYRHHEDFALGSHALAGLAFLSASGAGPEVERTAGYLLRQQKRDGLFSRSAKPNMENAYVLQLLCEVLLAHREGASLPSVDAEELEQAVFRGLDALVAVQTPSGCWPYSRRWGYEESATVVAVLEALYLGQDLGYPVPGSTFARALDYLRDRVHPEGGFLNGEKERVPSPHMSPAVLSILAPLATQPEVPGWITDGAEYVHRMVGGGYFADWGFEPGDPAEDNMLELKWQLSARRHLYGLYYLSLAAQRGVLQEPFPAIHEQAGALLKRYRTDRNTWNSTVGEVASTSLAVLTLTMHEGRLHLHRRSMAHLWY